MRSRLVSQAIAALALTCTAMSSQAVMIVFDDLTIIQHQLEMQGISDIRTDIFDKGYRLVYAPAEGEPYPTGVYALGPKWRYNGRSVAAAINSCDGMLTITADDNNPFDVTSIDLTSLNGDPSFSVSFSAVTSQGDVVTHSITVDNAQWTRYFFPASFSRLQSLTWKQGDCFVNKPHMFDNIALSR
jgi:hypothetical protein